MSAAYLDSSAVIAIASGEPAATALERRLRRYSPLIASTLLEAEVLSTLSREGVRADPDLFDGITWVLPDRALTGEMRRALEAGPLRAADLWHIACALYVAEEPSELTFLTLDVPQRNVARAMGFAV